MEKYSKNSIQDQPSSRLIDELTIDHVTTTKAKQSALTLVIVLFICLLLFLYLAVTYFPVFSEDVGDVRISNLSDSNDTHIEPASLSGLDASGYVFARKIATVSAMSTGRLQDILVEVGQYVEKGDLIAILDETEALIQVEIAEAKIELANANLAAAMERYNHFLTSFQRITSLYNKSSISESEYDLSRLNYESSRFDVLVAQENVDLLKAEYKSAALAHSNTKVHAPFSGYVTAIAAQAGEMVSPTTAGGGFTRTGICTIVDLNSLIIEVDVRESFIQEIVIDQSVEITLNAYKDTPLTGTVESIIPSADLAKGTVKVIVAFDELDSRILPEMSARVSFR